MVKLRLKRYGKKREASYRIVAIDSRARRQGRPIQELGFYNPRTKETTLKTADIVKWLRQGAQPSETLTSILKKANVFELAKSGAELSNEPLRIPAQGRPTATAVLEAPAEVETEVTADEVAPEAAAETAAVAAEAEAETATAEAEVETDAAEDAATPEIAAAASEPEVAAGEANAEDVAPASGDAIAPEASAEASESTEAEPAKAEA
ncbi:MAG: 30S ribosomal protein S16 [Cyanobacteria bacterium P01_F01_bin.33]